MWAFRLYGDPQGNGSNKFWEHGTLAASETNACRFGTQIPSGASAVGAL